MPHDPPDDTEDVDPGFIDDSTTSEASAVSGVPAGLDEDQSPFEVPAAMADSAPEENLRRHAEMLSCLVADHPGSGVLVLQGTDADPQTGQERALSIQFEDSALVNGIRHIRTRSRRIAGQIVDGAGELAEHVPYHHLYAPLAMMDDALPSGRTGLESDIVGVLGLVAPSRGSPTTRISCRSNPTTCWRAATRFKRATCSTSRR